MAQNDINILSGACACERNQYTIELPTTSKSQVSIFFDNSSQSRRSQASPVAAWLRIPLDYYHSVTVAQFPDETHATIRRTFTNPRHTAETPSKRRQFCGYCGTHLTAFDEQQDTSAESKSELIDVTLGSLFDESLSQLEALELFPDQNEDDGEEAQLKSQPSDGLVKGGSIDNDTHIPEVAAQEIKNDKQLATVTASTKTAISRYMQHRGIPYFEEMIENSPLGRIRRQRGGRASDNGRTVVEWEVVEFEGDDEMTEAPAHAHESVAKRVKLGA